MLADILNMVVNAFNKHAFEKMIDVGAPKVEDLTQKAKDIVDDPNLVTTN